MAVYTPLERQQFEQLLLCYDLGSLHDYQGIDSGIENTNYFLITTSPSGQLCHWVLTLFENLERQELPYFCQLTRHLAQAGFAVSAPVSMRDGEPIFSLVNKRGCTKYGVIVPRLAGQSLTTPDATACAAVGEWLAKMHLALQDFRPSRRWVRDGQWLNTQVARLKTVLAAEEFTLVSAFLERYWQYQLLLLNCPQGSVHGDLFRDNVLFEQGQIEQGRISGVFDFYHACHTTLLIDLAIAANDWTVASNSQHDPQKLASLLQSYQTIRPWTDLERQAWPYCLEYAALSFWLSRLVSRHLPGYQQQSSTGETLKNPDEMKGMLLAMADPFSSVLS